PGIVRVTQNVAASSNGFNGVGATLDKGKVLTRQQQSAWPAVMHGHAQAGGPLQGLLPSHGCFGGVARPPYMKVGDQPQAARMLNGLVRRAVFAQTDGVVR